MWRVVQRGFWLKSAGSVKPSAQVVTCHNEHHRTTVDCRALVHCATRPRLNNGTDHDFNREEHGADGADDDTNGGPHCEWKEHVRYFRHDMWSSRHPFYYLEAIGWGTAVILGVQMSTICHRNHCRGVEERSGWCHCSKLSSEMTDKFYFNKWFISHIYYTAAHVSRFLMPDAQRSVKRILPPSTVTSASAADAEVHSTSPSDSSASRHQTGESRHQTGEEHDADLEEFQNELRDFVRNLRTPSTAEAPSQQDGSDLVANEWNQLVTSYVRGIRYNVLAVKHAQRGDYQSAALIWLRASKGRICNAKILFNLALCYQNGLGITKDIGKAMECYAKAAKLNHVKSAYNLAVLYLRSATDVYQREAVRLFEQAAGLGLKEAQRELGVLLTEPGQLDMDRAVTMFEKAAKQQDADAMYFLGICNERGLGTEYNEAKAAELYRDAASRGHVNAQHNLAVFFEHGLGGIPQDKTEAIRLYRDAALKGASAAAERLKVLQQHPTQSTLTSEGTVLSISDSSNHNTTQRANGSQPSTLSRFYRSMSSSSDASDDVETPEVSKRSLSPVHQGSLNFYLEPSLSDDEAPCREAHTSVQCADSGATKPHSSTSTEFGNLFNLMFSRRGPSCLPADQPVHHGSLGSFALPKGSFGSLAVLPHVSSFG